MGFDLDGTLAYYDRWRGIEHIGAPIPEMMDRLIAHLENGDEVRIFTARAAQKKAVPYIEEWLEEHGIGGLKVTNIKDTRMRLLYDDRCIQVEKNTGRLIVDD